MRIDAFTLQHFQAYRYGTKRGDSPELEESSEGGDLDLDLQVSKEVEDNIPRGATHWPSDNCPSVTCASRCHCCTASRGSC